MNSFISHLAAFASLLSLLAAAPASAAAPSGRYAASGGVVHDSKTGLDWQQVATATVYTYAGAQTYCSSNTPGLPGTGWHLPEIRQLQTLVDDRATTAPPIDGIFTGTLPKGYWSSTVYIAAPTGAAWVIYFTSGTTTTDAMSLTYYVRCVR